MIRKESEIKRNKDLLCVKVMTRMQKKSMDTPDETRSFEKGKLQLATVSGVTFGRAILEPGWRWSTSVKPIAKTKSCEAPHTQYIISGQLKIVMDGGQEEELGPGDAAVIPAGHDAWVMGNEPVVLVDVSGMANYAK